MSRRSLTREDQRAQEINAKFSHLTQIVYLVSGGSAALGLATSLLLSNAGMAIAGLSTAGVSLYALAPSRERAARSAANLLIANDDIWERKIVDIEVQKNAEISALKREHLALMGDRQTLRQQLTEVYSQENEQQRQINALKAETNSLQSAKQSVEQELSARLNQAQEALNRVQNLLVEKRYELKLHLDSIKVQILDVWNPLHSGLLAICDRFDPSRPVVDLRYAGKPVTLDESEKRQWNHYRNSLVAYDDRLRKRIDGMSEECETHDEAYGFFLRVLEELMVDYCKLWSSLKDLELLSQHEGEKRSIYSEFENFRNGYVNDANEWVERSTTVEAGFSFIEETFKNELASLQQRIIDAERLIEELQAPRKFRGGTTIDDTGNRIIDHFGSTGIILDAVESVKIPGGFQLRFKIDRNPDSTRLAESEFDKHCEHMGLWALSQRPLDFDLDSRNFLLSVNVYTVADSKQRSAVADAKRPSAKTDPSASSVAERFHELDCYSAAEFEEVVRSKFVPRVRVVAGSTGGKSPLLELIACAIARIHKGELWLINPIPGSPKDWFHIPGVVAPGRDGIQSAIDWLSKAHAEFKTRRNDLPATAQKPFITVLTDEINAIARDYSDLGTVMKDFYQLSDHTRMGFLTAGQGGNVSGVSGGSKASSKTGNASKLMDEDFQNATQVFTAVAAKVWIEKSLKGSQQSDFLERLAALNQLCSELNQAEGKSAHPPDPRIKKVSPDAYRIALVVSPNESDPFFIQLPAYSSYVGQLDEVSYPANAVVTAPRENQAALGLIESEKQKACSCGCTKLRKKGTYKDGRTKYVCNECGRVPSLQD